MNLPLQIKRRFRNEFPKFVKSTYKWLNPNAFKNFEEYLDRVIFSSIRDFIAEHGQYNDYESYEKFIDLFKETANDFIMEYYYDEIYDYYKKEMNLQESVSRIKEMMGIKEVIEKLPQDSYVQMNVKNFNKFKKELTDILKPYLDNSNGNFVNFKNSIIKKEDKFNPVLQDYIPKDNIYLNNAVSGGNKVLVKTLYDIFKHYFKPEEKNTKEKNPCFTNINMDTVKLLGPITSKSENDLRNRWITGVGAKLYRVVLPEECYSQLNPEERAALFVTLEPNENRIHFPMGVPDKLRNVGLGKIIYLKTIEKVGYITSSLGSSPAVKMMYEDFLTNPEYKDKLLGLILQKNLLLIDKNTSLDVPQIFREFVKNKFTEQKYVEASEDLKSILGDEYTNWYNSLGDRNIDDLIEKNKDLEPKPQDTVIDVRDGKIYTLGYENIFDRGKPTEKTVIWLSGDKYKDKYIDVSEKSNLRVISRPNN